MIEFKLENNEFIALCDLLKAVGICHTGGHAKMLIAEGNVTVDGKLETRKRYKVRAGQIVEFDDQKIEVT